VLNSNIQNIKFQAKHTKYVKAQRRKDHVATRLSRL